jgi:hypothetical protein
LTCTLAPPQSHLSGITVKAMCNEHLTFKWNRVATGELSERTFHDYYRACDRLIDCLGPSRRVEYLAPVDFERL